MKKNRLIYSFLLLVLTFWGGHHTLANSYAATIEYRETLTQIVHEDDVSSWAPESNISFGKIATSADGSKIGFTVSSAYPNMGQHMYIMNGNGTGLTDITSGLPAEVDSASGLLLNSDGSRLFFLGAPGHTGYTDFYYCDTASSTCNTAILDLDLPGHRRTYSINSAGTRLFFRHNAGWDSETEKHYRGLYYADVGGTPVQVMDVEVLPYESGSSFQWYSMLDFLGISSDGSRLLFQWDRKWASTGMYESMWYVDIGGSPTEMPNEQHDYVWDVGCKRSHINNCISAGGNVALLVYKDSGEPEKVYAVDLATGGKTLVGEADGIYNAVLSPQGTFALFSGGGNRHTRVNLGTDEARDTLSTHISGWSECLSITDITSDDRYYFLITRPETGIGKYDYSRIHRIDMNPTDFNVTPNITDISFSAAALYHDESTTVTVYATVSDAQGLGSIEWVKMHTLVNGREFIDWRLEDSGWSNAEPLYYCSQSLLYYDGTHGDETAGDGIYTCDQLKTCGDSGFYDKYTLPHDAGIRIVARDEDDNYCIADTVLTITDDATPTTTTTTIDEDTTTTTTIDELTTTTTTTDSTTTTISELPCPIEELYGKYTEETEFLRNFRDNVLSQTPEGKDLIRLYYQLSPVIVKAMEADETFREEIRSIIDEVLLLIGTDAG